MLKRTNHLEQEDGEIANEALLEASLIYKQTANRRLGNYWLITRYLRKFLPDKKSISILDVGTGAADLPRFLTDWLAKRGLSATITGFDHNPRVIKTAKKLCEKYPNIHLVCSETLPDSPSQYNIAVFSQVLHHLTPTEAQKILKTAFERVTDAIIISDFIRNRAAYWLVKIVVFLTTTNHINRHDGPLSVLRSYNDLEIAQILTSANIKKYRIHHFFPRKVVVVSKM